MEIQIDRGNYFKQQDPSYYGGKRVVRKTNPFRNKIELIERSGV